MNNSLSDEMRAVIKNLETREWIQGKEVDGQKVCAHGAVKTCEVLRPGDEHILRAVMRRRGLTEDWNDKNGRTKAEVLARMRKIEISDVDLADTFGPNWRQVIAVIRKTAILTSDEAQRFDASWPFGQDDSWPSAGIAEWTTAWDVAWNAATDAARNTTIDTARDAFHLSVSDALQGVVWNIAAGAASAVIVADLVGQHGLTQDHIDTLMKPWIDALGDSWAEGMLP